MLQLLASLLDDHSFARTRTTPDSDLPAHMSNAATGKAAGRLIMGECTKNSSKGTKPKKLQKNTMMMVYKLTTYNPSLPKGSPHVRNRAPDRDTMDAEL